RWKRNEEDFVGESHIIGARLPDKPAEATAQPGLDVARGLGLEVEIDRKGIYADAFVDIRRAEAMGDATKHGKHWREAMLEAEMRRVIVFCLVEWNGLRIEEKCARRGRIKRVAGIEPHLLEPPAP